MLAKTRANERRILRYFADHDSEDRKVLLKIFTETIRPMTVNGFGHALEALIHYKFLSLRKAPNVVIIEVTESGRDYAKRLVLEESIRALKRSTKVTG